MLLAHDADVQAFSALERAEGGEGLDLTERALVHLDLSVLSNEPKGVKG